MQETPTVDLSGKTAVVTGGGGVLGREMSAALARCNAAVAILNRRLEVATNAAESINAAGGKAIALSCDVLDRKSLQQTRKTIEDQLGPINILVNAAGGNHPKGTTAREFFDPELLDSEADEDRTFYQLDPSGFQAVFDSNFIGTFQACQILTRSMAANENGVVINLSSMAAVTPLTKVSAYGAAKAAVVNFTQWLAVHLSAAGIRVNAIAPGFFLTEQNRELLTNKDGSFTERAEKIIAHTPLGRFGNADEVTGSLLWLVSDAASFVTGIVVPVDGGFSAYSGV